MLQQEVVHLPQMTFRLRNGMTSAIVLQHLRRYAHPVQRLLHQLRLGSIKPLRIATVTGAVFAILGFIYGIYTIIKKFVLPDVQIGFSALMSAVVFMGGAIMLMLGMIGEYLGRLYISQNKNPQFVIRETTRDENE